MIFLLQLHKLQVGLRQKSEGKRSQALESEVMKEEMEQYIGLESPASSAVVLLTTQNAVPLHAEIPSWIRLFIHTQKNSALK